MQERPGFCIFPKLYQVLLTYTKNHERMMYTQVGACQKPVLPKSAYFFVIINISVKNVTSCYFCFILSKQMKIKQLPELSYEGILRA